MASVKMMQGDSYSIPIDLYLDGQTLKPSMVKEVLVYVGSALVKSFTKKEVGYDTTKQQWYIRPTQEETLAMEPGDYQVIARVKFNGVNPDVEGVLTGRLIITEGPGTEVL